jgi:hypothetical protein
MNVRLFTRTLFALVLVGQGVIASPAQAAPNCFGKPATIVGTDGMDFLNGTGVADVIVGLGGSIESMEGAAMIASALVQDSPIVHSAARATTKSTRAWDPTTPSAVTVEI